MPYKMGGNLFYFQPVFLNFSAHPTWQGKIWILVLTRDNRIFLSIENCSSFTYKTNKIHISISNISTAVNKVTVVLQRDKAKVNQCSGLLDLSQVKGPLNKPRSTFTFSLPPLTLRNRDFSFLSSGWHKRPEPTIWEII